jgi:acetolactate synthase-1/2/3 large subunit
VIAIGTKFSQTGTWFYRLEIPNPLIHVDASSDVLGRNYQTVLTLEMDAGAFLKSLLEQKERLTQRKDKGLQEYIRLQREECFQRCRADSSTEFQLGAEVLHPYEFFKSIQTNLPQNAIVVTDSGFNERLTVDNWVVFEKRTLLNPSDYEAMGFGIPAAIGAAIANPNRQVIVIIGDGGLEMSGLEILTIVRQNLNIKLFVLNNNGFGIIKHIQEKSFGVSVAVDHNPPDFISLAKSANLPYHPANGGEETISNFLRQPGPGVMVVNMKHHESAAINKLRKRWKYDIKQGIQGLLN